MRFRDYLPPPGVLVALGAFLILLAFAVASRSPPNKRAVRSDWVCSSQGEEGDMCERRKK